MRQSDMQINTNRLVLNRNSNWLIVGDLSAELHAFIKTNSASCEIVTTIQLQNLMERELMNCTTVLIAEDSIVQLTEQIDFWHIFCNGTVLKNNLTLIACGAAAFSFTEYYYCQKAQVTSGIVGDLCVMGEINPAWRTLLAMQGIVPQRTSNQGKCIESWNFLDVDALMLRQLPKHNSEHNIELNNFFE